MKYKAGVWTCNNKDEMDAFFSHRPDGRIMPRVPEPIYAPDHTDPIWDYKWQVVLPKIAVMSMETLARVGLAKTGIKSVDEKAHERIIYPYLSINDIITIEDNGHPITYMYRKDVVKIYDIVKDYLEFWKRVNNRINQDVHTFTDIPTEDLARLETYLDTLYPLVEKEVTKPVATFSGLMGRFLLNNHMVAKIHEGDKSTSSNKKTMFDNQGIPNKLGA